MSATGEPSELTQRVSLTPEQKRCVQGVPGLAEGVAHDMAKRWGLPHPRAELTRYAHWGIATAATTYDPTSDVPFVAWARLKASMAVLDGVREDSRASAVIQTARAAACVYLSNEPEIPSAALLNATETAQQGALAGVLSGLLSAILLDVSATPHETGGEEELVQREDAVRAARGLRQAFDSLSPDDQEILRLSYDRDEDTDARVSAIAARFSTSTRSVTRKRNRALKLLGARLAGLGITEMPPWIDETWTAVLAPRKPGDGDEWP